MKFFVQLQLTSRVLTVVGGWWWCVLQAW